MKATISLAFLALFLAARAFGGGGATFTDANWIGFTYYATNLGYYPPGTGVASLAADEKGNLYMGAEGNNSGPSEATWSVVEKWNGTDWSLLGTFAEGLGSPAVTKGLILDGAGDLLVVGQFGVAQVSQLTHIDQIEAFNVAKWDGEAWSALGSGIDENYDSIYGYPFLGSAVAFDQAGNFYASSILNPKKWDGTNWTQLGTLDPNRLFSGGFINALVFDAAGRLYLGDNFGDPVEVWDGTNWTGLGGSVTGVNALIIDQAGVLYAGGTFSGGVAAWDGVKWSGLGGGISGTVNALALDPAGNLYAAGSFTNAGNVIASNIARWDGASWSALGSGVNSNVNALVIDPSGHLFAGGDFTRAGTNAAAYLGEAFLAPTPGKVALHAQTNGNLILTGRGFPGSTYIFQSTTDLQNWSNLSTNLCGTNGTWTVTNTPGAQARFFRTALLQ